MTESAETMIVTIDRDDGTGCRARRFSIIHRMDVSSCEMREAYRFCHCIIADAGLRGPTGTNRMLPRTRTGEAALRLITVNHVAVPAAFTRMPLVDAVVVTR
jgi:hypothetical protein